jgi:hypothetical protein
MYGHTMCAVAERPVYFYLSWKAEGGIGGVNAGMSSVKGV